MFLVKKKPLTPNTVWDGANEKPLCRFEKGIFKTDDQEVADKLLALGYEVIGEDGKPYTGDKADYLQADGESVSPANNAGEDDCSKGKTDSGSGSHGSGKEEK